MFNQILHQGSQVNVPNIRERDLNVFVYHLQKGYDDLQTIVPTCHQPNSATAMQKLSKAIVLQKCKQLTALNQITSLVTELLLIDPSGSKGLT